jgi:hypothetical protein
MEEDNKASPSPKRRSSVKDKDMQWDEVNANVFTPYDSARVAQRRKRANAKIKSAYLALQPRFEECFKKMDKDGNGEISKIEFSQAVGKAIRAIDPDVSNKELAEAVQAKFSQLDKNGDKRISWKGKDCTLCHVPVF